MSEREINKLSTEPLITRSHLSHLLTLFPLFPPQVKQSVLAVIQVASSVAMSCGLDEAFREDSTRCRGSSGTQASPQPSAGTGEAAVDAPHDIGTCQVSVRSLREMFDHQHDDDMEICTRL